MYRYKLHVRRRVKDEHKINTNFNGTLNRNIFFNLIVPFRCVLLVQERLEKEKRLTKDLGQAATKLQQLLKATQEQLAKEKDTVKTLQDQLLGQVA